MPEMILMDAEERMEHSLDALHREFTTVRSGRANPKMFERVTVDYYGAESPLIKSLQFQSLKGTNFILNRMTNLYYQRLKKRF